MGRVAARPGDGRPASGIAKCVFRVDEALLYGESAAIFVEKVRHWTSYNRQHHGPAADGFVWVYRSQEDWIEREFPFWSLTKLRRLTTRLEQLGVLIIEMRPAASGRDVLHYRLRPDLFNLDTPAESDGSPPVETDIPAVQTDHPAMVKLDRQGVHFGQVHSKDLLPTHSPTNSPPDSSEGLAVNGPGAAGAQQPAACAKPAWLKTLQRSQPSGM
jgi:hypothetical protein